MSVFSICYEFFGYGRLDKLQNICNLISPITGICNWDNLLICSFFVFCSCSDSYHLQEEYSKCEQLNNISTNWCPIDVNLMLPLHTALNQMPGLFPGKERIKKNYGKGMNIF